MIKPLLLMIFFLTSQFEDKQFVQDEYAAVERLSNKWAEYVGKRNPEKIASLYSDPFILFATFSNAIDTREKLLNYFETLAKKENLKVVYDEENIRVYGATAVNSGLYTFSYQEEGKQKQVPARFTFIYTLTPSGWRIVDHHSSLLPQ